MWQQIICSETHGLSLWKLEIPISRCQGISTLSVEHGKSSGKIPMQQNKIGKRKSKYPISMLHFCSLCYSRPHAAEHMASPCENWNFWFHSCHHCSTCASDGTEIPWHLEIGIFDFRLCHLQHLKKLIQLLNFVSKTKIGISDFIKSHIIVNTTQIPY